MRAGRVILAVVGALVVVALIAFVSIVWRSDIAPVDPPQASSFDPVLVKRGAQLAALGDCTVCHTTAGGKSFAGGLPIATPFGTIYSTNITPDPDTGIGRWSETAFQRAMHEGVSRDGRFLYPAFPYDHFAYVRDEDVKALYAFLMTRPAVMAKAHSNNLAFPISFRPILAGWNLLFLHRAALTDDPPKGAEWNRGRYLTEGLGHCGACHTPRNSLGAERSDQAYAGGEAEGWLAPALNAASPDPAPWTSESLYAYLKTGFEAHHSFAAGPMGPVVLDLRQAADEDIRAISVYIASLQGEVSPGRLAQAQTAESRAAKPGLGMIRADAPEGRATGPGDEQSAQLYASSCGWCHYNGDNKGEFFASRQKLGLGIAANAPVPSNLLHVIIEGIPPAEGEVSPIMPGFSGSLTDDQVTALARYIRAHFSDKPAWGDVSASVNAVRGASARGP